MSDTVMHLRALVRDPIKEAYGISKAMAKTNDTLLMVSPQGVFETCGLIYQALDREQA